MLERIHDTNARKNNKIFAPIYAELFMLFMPIYVHYI